jgi:hypothetical protein
MQIKPGQVLNPNGRAPYFYTWQTHVQRILTLAADYSSDEIKELASKIRDGKRVPHSYLDCLCLVKMADALIDDAVNEKLTDRLIGKVANKIESQVNVTETRKMTIDILEPEELYRISETISGIMASRAKKITADK